MFAEIDSLFPSRFVHLGADETFELGRGQTADRVKTVGIGVVYLDFLRQIADALRPSGKKFLFWGDVALSSPELVNTIPKDLIAVPWTYGADTSYVRFIKPFRDVGMATWVAPGVSSWNRIYPNNANALVNIQRFVRDGQRLGATGITNTSWDDDGDASEYLFWLGRGADGGRSLSQGTRPYTHGRRIVAVSTVVFVAEAEPVGRERDAIEAMELGARRVDFIGMKFQLADEVVAMYN